MNVSLGLSLNTVTTPDGREYLVIIRDKFC